jgi:hypothetical protein
MDEYSESGGKAARTTATAAAYNRRADQLPPLSAARFHDVFFPRPAFGRNHYRVSPLACRRDPARPPCLK